MKQKLDGWARHQIEALVRELETKVYALTKALEEEQHRAALLETQKKENIRLLEEERSRRQERERADPRERAVAALIRWLESQPPPAGAHAGVPKPERADAEDESSGFKELRRQIAEFPPDTPITVEVEQVGTVGSDPVKRLEPQVFSGPRECPEHRDGTDSILRRLDRLENALRESSRSVGGGEPGEDVPGGVR